MRKTTHISLMHRNEQTTLMGKYHNLRLNGGLSVLLFARLTSRWTTYSPTSSSLLKLCCTLGVKLLGEDVVSQSGDLTLTLLDDDKGEEEEEVNTDDASMVHRPCAHHYDECGSTSVHQGGDGHRKENTTPCFMVCRSTCIHRLLNFNFLGSQKKCNCVPTE